MSDIQYYDNRDSWGNYQFTTIDEIVNNILANRSADDFISVTERYKIVYQLRRGIRELVFDVTRDIKAIELELSPSLNIIFPPDFVDYVRISWVDSTGTLRPMVANRSLPIFTSYLQDNNYKLLFDSDGNVLTDSETSGKILENKGVSKQCGCYEFQPNKDNSKSYPNGSFSIDKSSGIIQFGSDIEGKSIILEYLSDGVNVPEGDIKIHKFAETALIDFVYYELIKNRRTVPANEKMRARKEYYNSRRIAKRRINKFSKEELVQAMKGSTKWIK